MSKNLFSLRIIGLAAISSIAFSGGVTGLPEATAQSRPSPSFETYSGGQDFFCDRGTHVSGFPFNLFAWDAIPWGIERKEFLNQYKEQIKQCDWEVSKKGKEIFARYRDPEAGQVYGEAKVVAQVKFSFYGENKSLSRVEIYDARSISPVASRLSQQFGDPQEAVYLTLPRPDSQAQTRIYKGAWFLPKTDVKAISSWHLVFEPLSIKDIL